MGTDWGWVAWVAMVGVVVFLWSRRGVGEHVDMVGLQRIVDELRTEKNALIKALVEARVEIDAMREEIHAMKSELAKHGIGSAFTLARKFLLMAISDEAGFQLDLAAARSVSTITGLTVRRLQHLTFEKLQQTLDRAREHSRAIQLVHLGVHSSQAGLLMNGDLVTAVQLSEILSGVVVLLIAGCQSDSVGDYLGVVPFVVTITEDVRHEDASKFAQLFWSEVASGHEPGRALERALERAPSGMSEYVERHW